jgi:hypothetical protein
MSTPISLKGRKGRLLGLRDTWDLGGEASMLFYTGVPPATPDTATPATLLGEIEFASPSGLVGESGNLATLTLTVPRVTLASASGLIGWVRIVDAAGDGYLDLLAAESDAPVIINAAQVFAGGEIQLLSCVLSE